MEKPDVYQLTRIRWQIFGTLTFRSERLPETTRHRMWFAHARQTCENFGCYFPSALWCLRQERGEATGRRHFHYLFGGLPENAITEGTCFAQMAEWERLGGGMARVRVYNHALNGVGYLTKCLSGLAADQYELSKFGLDTSEIRLSKGGEARLHRVIREERRHVERLEKRRSKGLEASSVSSSVGVHWVSLVARKDSIVSLPQLSLSGVQHDLAVNSADDTKASDEVSRDGSAGDSSHSFSPTREAQKVPVSWEDTLYWVRSRDIRTRHK